MLNEAFFLVCEAAVPAKASYVSLYVKKPFYGGPEEGGWWGEDTTLVAYHRCETEVQAEAVQARVEELAREMSDDARRGFTQGCQAQMEWLNARGLDADYLPEVDGEKTYWVAVEDRPGEHASLGCRHYE
jgi:hypothetical protein